MFDADGDALGVVVYNTRENPTGDGYIEFWNVTEIEGVPALERTAARADVVRGPHTMALVRWLEASPAKVIQHLKIVLELLTDAWRLQL